MYSCHFPQPGDPWGREAPAIFKRRHTYYMITSGANRLSPQRGAVGQRALDPRSWTVHGSPCIGEGSGTTFNSQFTAVFKVADRPGCFIGMADRWNSEDIEAST